MKTIHEELKIAIQNVADNYGVLLKTVNVDWIDISHMGCEKFTINRIEVRDAKVIRVALK